MSAMLRCLALCLVLPVVATAAAPPSALPATPAAPAEPAAPAATPAPAPPAPVPPDPSDTDPAPPDPSAPAAGAVAKGPPAFVQLDDSRFKVGEVEFNKQTRVIRFPAVLNQREGLLEYVIVHDRGKVHESLLRTSINPTHLNLALKLLRYESSPELFPLHDAEGNSNGRMPKVAPAIKAAARVEIRFLWNDGATEHSATVNECINNTKTNKPMAAGPWIYGGSAIYEGRFVAEMTGDIVAILTNEAAIFNFPGDSNKVGENYGDWFVLTKLVPAIGTPVTVQISPWQATPAAKPRPASTKSK